MRFGSQKPRNIALSRGVGILTDGYLVLSQFTHAFDGQTDRQRDRKATATARSNKVKLDAH